MSWCDEMKSLVMINANRLKNVLSLKIYNGNMETSACTCVSRRKHDVSGGVVVQGLMLLLMAKSGLKTRCGN